MKSLPILPALALCVSPSLPAEEQVLFDGESLTGWDGDPKFWTVKDGSLTGTTTKENPTAGNTFLIYTGDHENHEPVEFSDFVLTLTFRIAGHNSGIQYRSFRLEDGVDRWRVGGYQSDFDAAGNWAGTNYGEKFRGILAKRGEKVTITGSEEVIHKKKGTKRLSALREVEALGEPDALAQEVKPYPAWNTMEIRAQGNQLTQMINGVTMSEVTDDDAANRRSSGLIAIQLHGGPPMEVQVKEVTIETL
ncbi:MAG: DUF1080 domain-containing protein [Verrucomicrobiota bacterium]